MKRLVIFVGIGLPMLLILGLLGFVSMQSNEVLIISCTDNATNDVEGASGPLISLPSSVFCGYLKHVRDPDPNQAESSGHSQTVFGFTLAGHTSSGNTDSLALIEHFIQRGVQWDKAHDGPQTPLHLAVLYVSEDLVRRFLNDGAVPSVPIDAPSRVFHNMNALDFARLLRKKATERGNTADQKAFLRIETLLAGSEPIPAGP